MTPTRWQFSLSTTDAWRSMKEACLNARKSIDIEQYIIERDDVGSELLEILIRKRREGVHVRILADMVGSYGLFASSVPESLSAVGIEVRFFNIIRPWRIHNFFSWFFRDHRKILVIDSTIGFVGGVGFRSDMRRWRDTHVKVVGRVVEEMRHAFEEMWETAGKENFFRRMKRTRSFGHGFHFLTNSPFLRRRFIYRELLAAITKAQKNVFITTPYFIPDGRLRRALRLAARRGVDVRILVPHTSNFISVDTASHSCFDALLRAGVKIFLYKNEMLHAKTAVIDGSWATVGSFNLDSLSFFYNYEANLVSTSDDFAAEVEAFFRKDLEHSEEVTLERWVQRSILTKIHEALWLPLRRLL